MVLKRELVNEAMKVATCILRRQRLELLNALA